MKIKTIHYQFLILATFTGCAEDDAGVKSVQEEAEVYFEVTHSNDAWNKQQEGFIIDKAGNIRTYKNPVKWNEADSSKGMLTATEIKENISITTVSDKKVDLNAFNGYTSKIPDISSTEYTKPAPGGNDRGITSYYAYHFEPKKQLYVSILLGKTGDWQVQNKDSSAIEISKWLAGIKAELK